MDNPSVTASNLSGAAGGIGTILSLIGNMSSAGAARRQGAGVRKAAEFEAAQLEQNAGQAQAAAQREAAIERRREAMLISRGIAVAAAGGGAVTDPTVGKLLEDIAAEGAYRSGVAIYQGEEKARQMTMAADARRREGVAAEDAGDSKSNAYMLAGLGQAAQGAASLFGKYGQGGPKKKAAIASNEWLDTGTTGYGSMG